MQTVLFTSTIFGPIHSRRLGTSLGVNLMPNDGKICSFDCLYCEAGYNAQGPGTTGVAKRESLKKQLKAKLKAMHEAGEKLDVITFSGNGEPTVHPQFKEIVHDVINLRNQYFPDAKVTVLSNATMAGKPSVIAALKQHSQVKGLFWWWPEANEYNIPGQNQVTSSWWNGSLFDNRNGIAQDALYELKRMLE